MRKEQTLSPVDGVALQKAFDRFVPKNFTDVQVGEIYGGQNDGEFCLIQKKSPRSLRILTNECLCFKVDPVVGVQTDSAGVHLAQAFDGSSHTGVGAFQIVPGFC